MYYLVFWLFLLIKNQMKKQKITLARNQRLKNIQLKTNKWKIKNNSSEKSNIIQLLSFDEINMRFYWLLKNYIHSGRHNNNTNMEYYSIFDFSEELFFIFHSFAFSWIFFDLWFLGKVIFCFFIWFFKEENTRLVLF